MDGDRHPSDTSQHQVVKFRPRTSSRPPTPAVRGLGRYFRQPAADDLGELEADQPDDFRQRMAMNVVALVFTMVLTAAGIWLALKIADLRSTQDCVLMGRRDCAHVSSPAN